MKYTGLNRQQVEENRNKYGTNEIAEAERDGFWKQFLEGFNDPMIRILCVIAAVMIGMFFAGQTEWFEPVGTLLAVLIVNFVTAKTGVANDNAYAKLKASQKKETAKVIRDGSVQIIEVQDIVVGDIIVVQSGDKILADGVLIDGNISVDNSALNGEAEECHKKSAKEGFKIPDQITGDTFVDESSLFRGATVLDGEGYMEVQKVGMSTMMGKMAEDMAGDEPDSPLKVKLAKLANQISVFGYIGGSVIAVAIFVGCIISAGGFSPYFAQGWGVVVGDIMSAVSVAITIIVCAVPEGLPLVIALVLMQNTGKLLKHNVLVRKSEGIETAGSLNILFSDKTGTITKGHPEVTEFFLGNSETCSPEKKVKDILNLCIARNTEAMFDAAHNAVGGNMTDRALINFIGEDDFNSVKDVVVTDFQNFNSSNKFTQAQIEGKTIYKGAPEKILARSAKYMDTDGNIHDIDIEKLNAKIDELANKAMRVLAFGYSNLPMQRDSINDDTVLVGLVAMRDDVRPEAKNAIKGVQDAGIQVVMITGDRLETAVAIAKDASLIRKNDYVLMTNENKDEVLRGIRSKSSDMGFDRDVAISSNLLAELTDDEIKEIIPYIRVIARALPTDKSRMVKVCQSMNLVVGMTGDGVNDAPALKRADIGFAMGSGTAVAKEAGDLVILDDNFKSIKDAIWFGRTIYINILKFCKMQLVINVGAVVISSIGPFLGVEEPLKVTHLLWVNMVMDSLASIMMAGEPALLKYMKDKPRRRDESIISKPLAIQIGIMAAWLTVIGVAWLKMPFFRGLFENDAQWLTGYFCLFIFASMMNALNIRSEGFNLFSNIKENPTYIKMWIIIIAVQALLAMSSVVPGVGVVANMFSCEAFGLTGWMFVILMSMTMIPVDMVRKLVFGTYKEKY